MQFRIRSIALFLTLLILPSLCAFVAEVQINLRSDGSNAPVFEVLGLDSLLIQSIAATSLSPGQFARFFSVHVLDQNSALAEPPNPPILGTYQILQNGILFTSRFPLQPGIRYRAIFDPAKIPGIMTGQTNFPRVEQDFQIPKAAGLRMTIIENIYPTNSRLPENILKFYLSFSGPMRRGDAYSHIGLLDSNGKAVDLPFLELDEELWDGAGKRLTLFVDPGRIKKGLRPREEVGPVFENGKSYTLIVDSGWKDASGTALLKGFAKKFLIGPADEELPDPGKWNVQPPRAGTKSSLIVEFPEPLDYAMLQRILVVRSGSSERLQGKIGLGARETRWLFSPDLPWVTGKYELIIDANLEDLAGNNIARPFEVDEFHPIELRVTSKTVSLPFIVRK